MIELCKWPRVGSANSFEFLKVLQLRTTDRAHEGCREEKLNFRVVKNCRLRCPTGQSGLCLRKSLNTCAIHLTISWKICSRYRRHTSQQNIPAFASDTRQKCCNWQPELWGPKAPSIWSLSEGCLSTSRSLASACSTEWLRCSLRLFHQKGKLPKSELLVHREQEIIITCGVL